MFAFDVRVSNIVNIEKERYRAAYCKRNDTYFKTVPYLIEYFFQTLHFAISFFLFLLNKNLFCKA